MGLVNHRLSDLDTGDKSTDIGDERARRHNALLALREAISNEERVEQEAAAATAAAASTAMWLGASLADLAAVTGRTRQAARKRWPMLGDIHRRRVWLGNHVDEIRWAASVIIDNAGDIEVPDRSMFEELRQLHSTVGESFGGTAVQGEREPESRWHDLARLVDVILRGIVDTAEPTTGQAEFAVSGGRGVVGYYDHASSSIEPDTDQA